MFAHMWRLSAFNVRQRLPSQPTEFKTTVLGIPKPMNRNGS